MSSQAVKDEVFVDHDPIFTQVCNRGVACKYDRRRGKEILLSDYTRRCLDEIAQENAKK